jgi:hypothetical protein
MPDTSDARPTAAVTYTTTGRAQAGTERKARRRAWIDSALDELTLDQISEQTIETHRDLSTS